MKRNPMTPRIKNYLKPNPRYPLFSTETEPREAYTALDLFCGGGGGALGLQWAGFRVTGIDKEARLRHTYPGNFIQWDLSKGNLPVDPHQYDFILASPPCQRFSIATYARGNDWREHPNLIPRVREILGDHPCYAIENVTRAPLRPDVTLTGPSIGLFYLQRKRIFELSLPLAMSGWMQPPPALVPSAYFREGKAITATTSMSSKNHFYARLKIGKPGRPHPIEAKHLMGFPICFPIKMRPDIGNALVPPMAEFIAKIAINWLKATKKS